MFCFVVMRFTESRCFRLCSWYLLKSLDEEGCMGLVPWCLDLQCKSSWILNDFFTGNSIVAENFRGIGMCLWCCWKDLDEEDLMESIEQVSDSRCGRYWFFKVISAAENYQINSKKPGFIGRKNQLRTWSHLGQWHRPY